MSKAYQVWTNVKQYFTGSKPDKILGLDIGTSGIKAAEIWWRSEQPVLHNFGLADFPSTGFPPEPDHSAEGVREAVRQVLATNGMTAHDAVLAVSGEMVISREIVLPVMTPKEMREAIRWDLAQYVPQDPDAYYFDFAVMGSGKTELEQKVLLVAAPRSTVDGMLAVCAENNLHPLAIDIEPLALYRLLPVGENTVFLDVGGEVSRVAVFESDCPVVIRSIPIGGRRFTQAVMETLDLDFTEAERLKRRQAGLLQLASDARERSAMHESLAAVVDELVREIRRTVEYYQIQNKQAAFNKLYACGGGAKMGNLLAYISEQLNVSAVTLDPLRMVTPEAGFDPQYLTEVSDRLAVAAGLALRGGSNGAN